MSLQEEYYKTTLQQIKRGYSKGKFSNAKIYYLLSVIDRIADRTLHENKILFDDVSLEYYERQCKLYSDVITPLIKPYFHLSSSLFYHIKWKVGVNVQSYAKTPSSKFIKENAEFAFLDDAFWKMLRNEDYRKDFKQLIIRTYLN